jgi:flagellar protein FlbD
MIRLTRLSHASIVLNAELIQWVESTPDTVVTLTNGQKLMVLESASEVAARTVEYRREISGRISGQTSVQTAGPASPSPEAQP